MLTDKQQAFCQAYIASDGHGGQAALAAGYKCKDPESQARRLLALPKVQIMLETMVRDALWRSGLSPTYLAQRAQEALDATLDAKPVTVRGKTAEGNYVIDAKTASDLLKTFGKWTGLEDAGDRKLNHEAIRMDIAPEDTKNAITLHVPRPDPGAWERAREDEDGE